MVTSLDRISMCSVSREVFAPALRSSLLPGRTSEGETALLVPVDARVVGAERPPVLTSDGAGSEFELLVGSTRVGEVIVSMVSGLLAVPCAGRGEL